MVELQIEVYIFACVRVRVLSVCGCPTLCNPMDCIACQASLSVEFSRQEYWTTLPFPSLGDLSNPGIEPTSLASPALAGRFLTNCTNWEALNTEDLEINRRRQWRSTPVFLPGESQGQRSLVGCCLWGRKESDTIEAT